MKIADFFIQITAKGDLKELKMIADAQKAIKEQSKVAIATAKVKVQQLKKETAEIVAQKKAKKEESKTLKDILIARGKMFDQQNRMNILMAKGIAQTALMKSGFLSMAAAVVGVTLTVDKMVMKLAQANQSFINFQRQTGMSIQTAQGMSAAMANLDVSMSPEQIMQSMQSLQTNLVGIGYGQGNIGAYQIAGVPIGLGNIYNAEGTFENIRKALRGRHPAEQTYLLQQMGLDPRLGALINMSDKEYAQMKAEQSMLYLDPKVRKDIQELGKDVNKLFLTIKKMFDLITVAIGHAVRPLGAFLKMAVNSVNVIVEALEKLPAVLKTIEVISLAIIAIWTKGLVLLLPIIEDLAVWAAGGNSFFKEFFNDPEKVLKAVGETFSDWFKNIFGNDFWTNLTKAITDGIRGVFKGKPNAERIEEAEGVPLWLKLSQGRSLHNKVLQNTQFGRYMFLGSLMKDLLLNSVKGQGVNTSYGNSVDMDNVFNIHVGSVADGMAMNNAIDSLFANSIIAQMQRGY